jgi:hypothetical protein
MHEVIVFATSREGAAEGAIDKVKDKIRRGHWQRSWAGKITDPWTAHVIGTS